MNYGTMKKGSLLASIALWLLLTGCNTSLPVEDSLSLSVSIQEQSEAVISTISQEEGEASRQDEEDTVEEADEELEEITEENQYENQYEENRQLLTTYYDDYAVAHTEFDGCILSLWRADRAWLEACESISSGDWPIWDYGVTHYPYARDDSNIYQLVLPMTADTNLSDNACRESYESALWDTLDKLKEYAKAKGLELNPSLETDFSTIVTRLMGNAASTADPILEKLSEATVYGDAISQNVREAFCEYLTANPSLWAQVKAYHWRLYNASDGTTGLEFDGTDSPGGGYGTSIHYESATGSVMTLDEYDQWTQSRATQTESTEESVLSEYAEEAQP